MLPRIVAGFLSIFLPMTANAAPDTITIPLVLKNILQKDGNTERKLGMWVGLGGGAKKLYEFDTGASGFYAAYSPAWWHNYRLVNPGPVYQTYSSGNVYGAEVVSTKVDFGHGVPKIRADVALVNYTAGKVSDWFALLGEGQPPLDTYFYGDFGIGLGKDNGLFGLLPQLPGNLSSGFIVSTGGYSRPRPFLTIGLTEGQRAQFPIRMGMHRKPGGGIYPGRSHPARLVYEQELIDTMVTLQKGDRRTRFSTGVVLDTGAPSTVLRNLDNEFRIPAKLIDASGSGIVPHTQFTMTGAPEPGLPPWILGFSTGNKSGFDVVSVADTVIAPHKVAYTNSGITAFFRYDVMFDVENGEVGFRRIAQGNPLLHVDGATTFSTGGVAAGIQGTALARAQLIDHIEYRVGAGPFLLASGVTKWSFIAPLAAGSNEITIRAVDIAGKSSSRKIVVTRE
jgi:hypothetical protein